MSLTAFISFCDVFNATEIFIAASSKELNLYFRGTKSVWPQISGTIGIRPALMASAIEIPNGSSGVG